MRNLKAYGLALLIYLAYGCATTARPIRIYSGRSEFTGVLTETYLVQDKEDAIKRELIKTNSNNRQLQYPMNELIGVIQSSPIAIKVERGDKASRVTISISVGYIGMGYKWDNIRSYLGFEIVAVDANNDGNLEDVLEGDNFKNTRRICEELLRKK